MTGRLQHLLVIAVLSEETDGSVLTGDIATLMDCSPAAATEMVQRLDSDGLVTHRPYGGVELTNEGKEEIEGRYETYVAISRFFEHELGLTECDREAIAWAVTISPDVAERLNEMQFTTADIQTISRRHDTPRR